MVNGSTTSMTRFGSWLPLPSGSLPTAMILKASRPRRAERIDGGIATNHTEITDVALVDRADIHCIGIDIVRVFGRVLNRADPS